MSSPSLSLVLELDNAELLSDPQLAQASVQSLLHSIRNAPENQQRRIVEFIFVTGGGANETEFLTLRSLVAGNLEATQIVTLLQPEAGYYEKKMLGALRATGEFVVFVDSDVIYSSDWFEEFSRDLVAGNPPVLFGETFAPVGTPKVNSYALTWQFPFRHRADLRLHGRPHEWSNNWAVRTDVIRRHPIPRISGHLKAEGLLWKATVVKAGVPVAHSQAWGFHRQPESFMEWFALFWRSGKSRAARRNMRNTSFQPFTALARAPIAVWRSLVVVANHRMRIGKDVRIHTVQALLLAVIKNVGIGLGYSNERIFSRRKVNLDYSDLLSTLVEAE